MLSINNADGTKENAGNGGSMKKKIVSVLLTATMAAGLLAGCGGNSGDAQAKGGSGKKGIMT